MHSFLSKNLKLYRCYRTGPSMSQSKLAKKLGVSQATIAHLESGRKEPSLELILKLMKCLDCSFENLFLEDLFYRKFVGTKKSCWEDTR